MKSRTGDTGLYQYFIFYLLIQITSFITIALLFTNKNTNEYINNFIVIPLLVIILLATNIFILYLLKKVFIKNRKSEKLKLELRKYQYLESDLKLYRQHRHDMKNHLMIIYELVNNKQYDDLSDYTKKYLDITSNKLQRITTGVDELDVLIYSKFDEAKTLNINVDFHCSTKLNVHYNTIMDLISIISNLLDNAIEANAKIINPNDKTLSVAINEDQLDYTFIITNAFVNNINSNKFSIDGFTTKKNSDEHGLGIGIVTNLVSKYNGQLSVEIFNDIFYQIKIDFPKHLL